jgi:hypothetical protein
MLLIVCLPRREQEVDAQLRALRMSELPDKLQPEQLQALLQQCRQQAFQLQR